MKKLRCVALVTLWTLAATAKLEGQLLPPSFRPFLNARAQELRQQANSIQQRAAFLESRRSALLAEASSLGAETVQSTKEKYERDIAVHDRQVTDLTNTANQLLGAVRELNNALRARETELRGLEESLRTAQAELATLNEDEQSRSMREGIQGHIKQLGESISAAQQAIEEIQNNINARNREKEAAEQEASRNRSEAETKRAVLRDIINGLLIQGRDRLLAEARIVAGQVGSLTDEVRHLDEAITAETQQLRRWWLPARTEAEAEIFFGQEADKITGGRTGYLSFGKEANTGSATVELASLLFGPVRITATGVMAHANDTLSTQPDSASASDEEANTSDINRFFAGGGNLVFSGAFPLLGGRFGALSGTVQLLGKVGIDTPGNSAEGYFDDTPANFDGGLDAYFSFGNDLVQLFGFGRVGWVTGTSAFSDQVGKGRFSYAQGVAGGEIFNLVRVLVSSAQGPGFLAQKPRLTVQFTAGTPSP
jgi:hypothetical protein